MPITLSLIAFKSFDFSLVKLLLLGFHLCNLYFGPQGFTPHQVSDAFEHVGDFIVYLLEHTCLLLVEVVEESDQLYKTEINESILSTNDATILLHFTFVAFNPM